MFKDHQTPSLMPREAHAPDRFDLECLSGGVVSPIFAHASPQATKSVQQAQGNASQNASPMGVAPSFPDSTGGDRLLSSPWMFTDREDAPALTLDSMQGEDNMQGEHVDRSEGGGPAQKRTNTKRSRAVTIAMGLAEGSKGIKKYARKPCAHGR